MNVLHFARFAREPGGIRILLGGALVALLILATAAGERWTRYSAWEMDLEHQLVPPASEWLMRLTTTASGRQALLQSRQSGAPESGDEEEDVLGMLRDGEPSPAAPGRGEEFSRLGGHGHVLGTDQNGRDMTALLVAGARNCFLPGLLASAVALGLGVPLGLLAGFYGRAWLGAARFFNGALLSMPRMVLILVVICAVEPNVFLAMGVLGVTLVPRVSELISARVRVLARQGFILAAREGALGDFRILSRHLFWYQNRAVFFIQFSWILAESILVETTLSYLQFGAKPPDVSWGNIIEGGRLTFFSGQYWITFFPSAAIILAILGFFYLGDGMNARLAHREGR